MKKKLKLSFSLVFRGSSCYFRVDYFHIADFHSVLISQVSVWKIEDGVKIYNITMVNTEMARGPLKLS